MEGRGVGGVKVIRFNIPERIFKSMRAANSIDQSIVAAAAIATSMPQPVLPAHYTKE